MKVIERIKSLVVESIRRTVREKLFLDSTTNYLHTYYVLTA